MWKAYARILLAGLSLSCNGLPALATFNFTQGGSSAMFAFNSGTTPAGTSNCAAASTECPASVPINTAGSPLFITSTPGIVAGAGTLGTPGGGVVTVQGGSGGTNLPVSQATAASLNATVVGTGTFAVQAAQSGTWTVNPTTAANWGVGATGAAVPANAVYLGITSGGNLTGWNGAVTGTVTANAGTNLNTSLLALESGGNLATLAGAITAARIQANTSQINGVTPLMGNGVTGTGSQRVTIASDNTAFAVNATLQASSATAIGTVNPTTIGTWGLQASTQNSATPTNGALVLGQFNTTPTTVTSGNVSPLQMDNAGNLLVNIKAGAGSGGTAIADKAAWTVSSTTFTLSGGEFTTGGATACSTGQACTVGMTAARAFFVDLSSQAGTAITSVPSAYGTAPTGNVIGVNAFVTNATPGIANNADAIAAVGASSTSPVPVNNYGYVFNGTTWDRMRSGAATGSVAIAAASGALASGSIASGAVASGAFASGAFAAGSFLNATAGDPCMFQPKTNVAISTATGTVALVTGVSAKKIYVCSLSLITSGAISVSLAEGSSSTCGTSAQAAVLGVATNGTAANGIALPANGGITLGNGGGTVAQTATAANYLCLFQSGTTQMAGNLTYVQQ